MDRLKHRDRKMEHKKNGGFKEDSEYAELLKSIFEFMLMSGAARELILEIAQRALSKAAKKSNLHFGL